MGNSTVMFLEGCATYIDRKNIVRQAKRRVKVHHGKQIERYVSGAIKLWDVNNVGNRVSG